MNSTNLTFQEANIEEEEHAVKTHLGMFLLYTESHFFDGCFDFLQ